MASKAKAIKQEPSESKLEARSNLNKALAAAEIEKDPIGEYGNEDDDDGEVEHGNDRNDQDMDDDDEHEFSTKKYISKVQQQKQVIQQASYIMKLFDRSVNLAKFDEETPLYPLCRAWMANQPRALNIKSEKVPEEPTIQTVQDGDVIEIPRVRIRSKTKPLVVHPENKVNKKEFDKIIDSEVWTKEKLLEFHHARWQEGKARQIENSRAFEEKYFAANFELLESLTKTDDE